MGFLAHFWPIFGSPVRRIFLEQATLRRILINLCRKEGQFQVQKKEAKIRFFGFLSENTGNTKKSIFLKKMTVFFQFFLRFFSIFQPFLSIFYTHLLFYIATFACFHHVLSMTVPQRGQKGGEKRTLFLAEVKFTDFLNERISIFF